jgi:hypothetical protein
MTNPGSSPPAQNPLNNDISEPEDIAEPCSPYESFAINTQAIAKGFRRKSLSQHVDEHASIRQDPVVVVVRMDRVHVGICQKPEAKFASVHATAT